jgi:hypothetical protein
MMHPCVVSPMQKKGYENYSFLLADTIFLTGPNRTYSRIVAALPPDVAKRYGYTAPVHHPLVEQHNSAVQEGNWELAARLAVEIAARKRQAS